MRGCRPAERTRFGKDEAQVRFKQWVRDNGLIVLLDVLAVNLSYFLALIIRFYVNQNFRPTVLY